MIRTEGKRSIVLIGAGYWGKKMMKYIPKYFKLKYVADSKFDKNIIWEDSKVDSVIVATPVFTHYDISKEAILHGKNVYVCKPIACSISEANDIKEIARISGKKIAVDYTHTFSPSFKKLLEIANLIKGEIVHIDASTKQLGRFFREDVYWLLGSHHLSLLGSLFQLEELDFKRNDFIMQEENCTSGEISFSNSRLSGKINVSLNSPRGKEKYFNIHGQNWILKWTPLKDKTVEFIRYNLNGTEELVESHSFDESNNLDYSLRYFRDLLIGIRKDNIDIAVGVTKVLEECLGDK